MTPSHCDGVATTLRALSDPQVRQIHQIRRLEFETRPESRSRATAPPGKWKFPQANYSIKATKTAK